MRYCDHTFYKIGEDAEYETVHFDVGSGGSFSSPPGLQIKEIKGSLHAILSCVHCGQIRHLYRDGRVVVAVEEGQIIKKRNDQTTTDQKIS